MRFMITAAAGVAALAAAAWAEPVRLTEAELDGVTAGTITMIDQSHYSSMSQNSTEIVTSTSKNGEETVHYYIRKGGKSREGEARVKDGKFAGGDRWVYDAWRKDRKAARDAIRRLDFGPHFPFGRKGVDFGPHFPFGPKGVDFGPHFPFGPGGFKF